MVAVGRRVAARVDGEQVPEPLEQGVPVGVAPEVLRLEVLHVQSGVTSGSVP